MIVGAYFFILLALVSFVSWAVTASEIFLLCTGFSLGMMVYCYLQVRK